MEVLRYHPVIRPFEQSDEKLRAVLFANIICPNDGFHSVDELFEAGLAPGILELWSMVHHADIGDSLLWWDSKTSSVRSHCTTFSVCSSMHIVASVTTDMCATCIFREGCS